MQSPHRDRAVQTSSPGLTLIIDNDDLKVQKALDDTPHVSWSPEKSGVRRHFAQYGDQQTVSEDLALGWDCGICFETAEEPCVTRCGHLYCRSHLHHWLATHPSCPVCKSFCTPDADVIPIFSRGRTSPPSSGPSSPDSLTADSAGSVQSPLTPPPPQDTFSLSAGRAHFPLPFSPSPSGDFDFDMFPLHAPRRAPSPALPSPSIVAPLVAAEVEVEAEVPPSSHLQTQPRPHPLAASHMLAHHLGLVLRVLGLAILLGVLLR